MMRAHDIRTQFLEFFATRSHEIVASSSLVPENDPTLLFTNAGMVQFKDVFLGREQRAYQRATSSQRCLRAGGKHNDLENVGFTPRHHTFFEMLGNFSFGEYFKAEAIRWAWEFLTDNIGIPKHRLVVSVFSGEGEAAPFDEEARELWSQYVPRDRIYAYDAKDNFWQMGDTGPCGPCSEIHIFNGPSAPGDANKAGKFGPAYEPDRYMELWNLVFMQYEKLSDGTLTALPRPSIDTGAGLERLAAVVAGVGSNFDTELLSPLVATAKSLARAAGGNGDREAPFRVIADHARATAFLIADGVFPDRSGRAYVLRRIMRRAIRYGTEVGLHQPFFHVVCAKVVDEYAEVYPQLRARAATIDDVVRMEEEAFRRTLERGLHRYEVAYASLAAGELTFPPTVAADLYDTYGFPIDLTALICRERGIGLDEAAAEEEVKNRQHNDAGAVELGAGAATADIYFAVQARTGASSFLGYEATEVDSQLVAIIVNGREAVRASAGDVAELVFDRTPFYAEAGGQVGDSGRVEASGAAFRVDDTRKPVGGMHVHRGVVEHGTLELGNTYKLVVDATRRAAIRRNHSATHLLHHALRTVVGEHVVQKGSLVAPERLRFDFSHNRPLSSDQRRTIEQHVNREILDNRDTSTRLMSLEEAKRVQAIGLFEQKYGSEVRVVNIGGHSVELCGGTHVSRAGDIGLFAIVNETGVAQGVRRIEAVTGFGALDHLQQLEHLVDDALTELHGGEASELPDKLARLQAELRAKDRHIAALQRQLATGGSTSELVETIEGIKLLAKRVSIGDPKTLREAADALRDRIGSGVVVLAGEHEGKASLLVAVTKDLQGRVHAGHMVAALAAHVDGRGGGRPDLAQAGGPNVGGLDSALVAAKAVLSAELGAPSRRFV